MSKQLVKSSQYVDFYYEEDNQLITAVWLPATKELLDDELYKKACILTGEICKEYKPKSWIVDNRTLFFIITPDLQEWIDQEITPIFKSVSLLKMAVLLIEDSSEHLFENISMEQLMDEENTKAAWDTQFFSDEEQARAWLFAQKETN